jgi:hypothetical protein
MAQRTKFLLAGIAAFIVAALILLWFAFARTSWDHMVPVGHTRVDVSLIVVFLAVGVLKLLFIGSFVLFVMSGFRTHWAWGVVNLLLFPLSSVIFFFRHPRIARLPMILFASGLLIVAIMWAFSKSNNMSIAYARHSMCRMIPEQNAWRADDVAGRTFTLISQTEYGVYKFQNNGNVVATVGRDGGPLTGSIWEWRIMKSGALLIKDHDGRPITAWRKKSWSNGQLVVESDNGTKTFQTKRE